MDSVTDKCLGYVIQRLEQGNRLYRCFHEGTEFSPLTFASFLSPIRSQIKRLGFLVLDHNIRPSQLFMLDPSSDTTITIRSTDTPEQEWLSEIESAVKQNKLDTLIIIGTAPSKNQLSPLKKTFLEVHGTRQKIYQFSPTLQQVLGQDKLQIIEAVYDSQTMEVLFDIDVNRDSTTPKRESTNLFTALFSRTSA